jgi:hypothetical protein
MHEQLTEINPGPASHNQGLFSHPVVDADLKICVILPVRNEQEHIVDALEALRAQQDPHGNPLDKACYEILLLANNCTDDSVVVARAFQAQHPELRLHIEDINLDASVAHIGTVRRLLMDAAYDRLMRLNNQKGIIASTDSDSQVSACWLYHTIAEIEKGNDVVGGRILTRPEMSSSRPYYLRDITYKHLVAKLEDLIDPQSNDRWPRHFQCFGASLAVTCQMYELSGRLPVIPFLEDMAFHKSLTRVDAKIRLSPLVQVYTSSRIQGRVDFGLSIQLKQWGEMNAASHAMMVDSAEALIAKFSARKILREAWAQASSNSASALLSRAARLLGLEPAWLEEEVKINSYFGAFWEKIEDQVQLQGWLHTWPTQDVLQVIPVLKAQISQIQHGEYLLPFNE